ncbi:hypothetical protein N7539_001540 [Penicillium diatomitis]|uniref:Uncharacterized protein n=1 Tax=Penicillium diatomitis TaxID=2819901 RepID=A0A9W9XH55_9EURO|nr:uncharacterized protein N7539_001540 [Penicillium diatomitis]KAJ5492794.1 hypothetical protein N7539_001540 [Penicillium diatomitis]
MGARFSMRVPARTQADDYSGELRCCKCYWRFVETSGGMNDASRSVVATEWTSQSIDCAKSGHWDRANKLRRVRRVAGARRLQLWWLPIQWRSRWAGLIQLLVSGSAPNLLQIPGQERVEADQRLVVGASSIGHPQGPVLKVWQKVAGGSIALKRKKKVTIADVIALGSADVIVRPEVQPRLMTATSVRRWSMTDRGQVGVECGKVEHYENRLSEHLIRVPAISEETRMIGTGRSAVGDKS